MTLRIYATPTHALTAALSTLACITIPLSNGPLVEVSVKSLLLLRIYLSSFFRSCIFLEGKRYQVSAVNNWLASSAMKPPNQYYWPKNRGYPDVAAIGARTLIVSGGSIAIAGMAPFLHLPRVYSV